MTSGDPASIRIGTDERTAAMAALDEHLAKGRLGVEEYGDRSAAAANAVFAADLAALFTDLPAPHPTLPTVVTRPDDSTVAPHQVPAPDRAAERPATLQKWGPRLVAVSPILALLLFLATRQWWWFLLIPLAGALVFGGTRR